MKQASNLQPDLGKEKYNIYYTIIVRPLSKDKIAIYAI